MTKVNHPEPKLIAQYLRRIAGLIEDRGPKALDTASLLASRGFPAGGNGAGRSSDATSSTERAALNPNGWGDIDRKLALALRALWHAATVVEHLFGRVLAHASDDDPIPVGRGHCQACDKFCRGDGGNDRLRKGLCHRCNNACARYLRTYPWCTRSDFITATRRDQRDQSATSDNATSATVSG